jgi:hypothetical protein
VAGVHLGPADFRSMTTFASILDGLSNTTIIGEKAVHKDRLGDRNWHDGPYYYAGGAFGSSNPNRPNAGGNLHAFTRAITGTGGSSFGMSPAIPRKPTGDSRCTSATSTSTSNGCDQSPHNRFGSWHPGTTLFLLGDGSVRPVNNATSDMTLRRFGCRNDRLTFTLP